MFLVKIKENKQKGVLEMNFDGKKMVLLILVIIAIMGVVTYAIFTFMDRNQYIEEMGLAFWNTYIGNR